MPKTNTKTKSSKSSATKKKSKPAQQIKTNKGQEEQMTPPPVYEKQKMLNRLQEKVAIITGGDSGIGRAIAIAFAKEGAKLLICYHEDDTDATITKNIVEKYGGSVILYAGDIADSKVCKAVVEKAVKEYGKLDILINNAAVQFPQKNLQDISDEQFRRTFEVNIFSQFYFTKAAEKYLKEGSCIINTASVVAYRGNIELIDYSSTKGAIVSFTRTMSGYFAKKGVRVNAVAPGPIWTPLIPSTFSGKHVEGFGTDTPMGRPGEPVECAYAYVYLASDEASYISGQVIHVNGGEVVNG